MAAGALHVTAIERFTSTAEGRRLLEREHVRLCREQGEIALLPADIIVTRNAGSDGRGSPNPSPGHFNHAALALSATEIIEAQAHTRDGRISDDPNDPGSVVVTPWGGILARYPVVRVLRDNRLVAAERNAIVRAARGMIGEKYRPGASVILPRARHRRHIANCVSVVRMAYRDGTGDDPFYRYPDDVAVNCRLTEVWRKGE